MKRVIALGFFDGVHLGHGALLKRTVEVARALDAIPAACTFDVWPGSVTAGGTGTGLLTTPERRAALMREEYKIQEVLLVHFDRAMMTMPWDRFVTGFLAGEHSACHLVAGHDHRFGYRGEGTAEKLERLCASLGLGCDIIPPVTVEGERVRSSAIRAHVLDGQVRRAARFLGRPYSLEGTVIHGKGLGHTLGFPTVNLAPDPRLILPAHGVYAAQVRLEGGQTLQAVTNIGVRPTVDRGGQVSVESFLLDFDGDLYGRQMELLLHRRLRAERPFPSLEELRRAVAADVQTARDFFSGGEPDRGREEKG